VYTITFEYARSADSVSSGEVCGRVVEYVFDMCIVGVDMCTEWGWRV